MIEILKDTKPNILAVKATGKLTVKDYEETFIPTLTKMITEHGKIRVVIHFAEGFEGWELGAMWDDAKFGIKHRNDFEKIAIVGGPKCVEWSVKLGSHFISGQMKSFEESELTPAIAWVEA